MLRAHRVKFPDELIDVGRNRHLARRNVLIHASLALLPFLRPEPSLVGGHRDLGTQLNHSVVTLHDFDLRTGTIKMVSSSKIGWKYDFAPSSNTNERSLSHEPTIAELPQFRISVGLCENRKDVPARDVRVQPGLMGDLVNQTAHDYTAYLVVGIVVLNANLPAQTFNNPLRLLSG